MLPKQLLILTLLFISFAQTSIKAQVLGSDITYSIQNKILEVKTKTYLFCGDSIQNDSLYLIRTNFTESIVLVPKQTIVDSNIQNYCENVCTDCQNSNCYDQKIIAIINTYKLTISDTFQGSCKIDIKFKPGYRKLTPNYFFQVGDSTLLLRAQLNICDFKNNESPKFLLNPFFYAITNGNYIHSQGAVDILEPTQPDSLNFELVNIETENGSIQYLNGYSGEIPIKFNGFPNINGTYPKGFYFNNQSSNLAFRPIETGKGILKIRINEYRNNILIGFIEREFSISTVNNYKAKQAVITGKNLSTFVLPENFNISICENNDNEIALSAITGNNIDTFSTKLLYGRDVEYFESSNSHQDTLKIKIKFDSLKIGKGKYLLIAEVKSINCPFSWSSSATYIIEHYGVPKLKYTANQQFGRELNFNAIASKNRISTGIDWIIDGKRFNQTQVTTKVKKPGVYKYKVISKGLEGCNYTYVDSIKTNNFPYIEIESDSLNYCQNDVVQLFSKIYNTNETYLQYWNNTIGSESKSILLTNDSQIVVKFLTQSGFENSDTIELKTKVIPKFSIISNNKHCEGNTLELKPELENNQLKSQVKSILWYDDDLNVLSINSTLKVQNEGYAKAIIELTNGCKYTNFKEYKYTDFVITPIDEIIGCKNENGFFYVNKPKQKYFEWRNSNNQLLSTNDTLNIEILKTQKITLLSYDTSDNVSCQWIDTFRIIQKSQPKIQVKSQLELCQDVGLYDLNDSNFIEPTGGLWYDPFASRNSISLERYFDTKKAGAGLHNIWYEVIDNKSLCRSDSFISIKVNPTPTLFLADSLKLCVGAEIQILDTMATPQGGKWWGNGLVKINGINIFNPIDNSISKSNTIHYQYIDSNRCQNTDSLIITVNLKANPIASVTFGAAPITIEFSEYDNFEQCHVNKWKWYFGDRNNSSSTERIASFRYQEAGIYNLTLVVEDTISGAKDSVVKLNYIRLLPSSINSELKPIGIYPNPANDYLKIITDEEQDNYYYEISNSIGKIVQKGLLKNQFIELYNLSSSYYCIRIFNKQLEIKGIGFFIKQP